ATSRRPARSHRRRHARPSAQTRRLRAFRATSPAPVASLIVPRYCLEMRSVVLAVLVGCGGGVAQTAPPGPPAPKMVPVEPSESTAMPEGYVEMHAMRVVPTGDGQGAVLLADQNEDVALPIFIGGTESASIDARLEGTPRFRPLTHDLMDATLHELHA